MKIKFFAIGLLGLAMACSENELSKSAKNPAFTLNAVQQRALAVYDEQHIMKNTAGRVILGNPADLQSQLGDTPIDIPANKTQKFVSIDPQFHYEDFQLSRVLNTGENLKVVVSGTNYITIGGTRYDLAQFHFHRGSEHAIAGRFAAMEVHLVHISGGGNIAVIGVMLEEGAENEVLHDLFSHSPSEPGENSVDEMFNASSLLPNINTPYYHYSGSLTTPPFTKGLTWIVYKLSKSVAADELEQYEAIYEELNARPLQSIDGRVIYERTGYAAGNHFKNND